jgi:hypothetical protein
MMQFYRQALLTNRLQIIKLTKKNSKSTDLKLDAVRKERGSGGLPPDTIINNDSSCSASDYTSTNTDIDIYCYIL